MIQCLLCEFEQTGGQNQTLYSLKINISEMFISFCSIRTLCRVGLQRNVPHKILKYSRWKSILNPPMLEWYLPAWLGPVYCFGVWMGGRVGVVPTGLLVLLGLWVLLGVWVVDIIGGEGGNMGPLGEGKEKLLPGGNVLGFTSTTEKKWEKENNPLCQFKIALCFC